VIGINTAIVSPSGGSIGIGFAIPSNLAKNIVAQLVDSGKVRRGWLGVNIQQVTDEIAESLGLPQARGALVARAQEDGPAAKAGIRNGDVILSFNGHEVQEMRSLPRIVAETKVGSTVPMTIWRDGKRETLQVTVAELPSDQQQAATSAAPEQSRPGAAMALSGLGLKVAPLSPEMRDRFSLKEDARGVVITEVQPGSSAAERGLSPGDLIVEVQQNRVSTPQEVQEQLARLRRQNRPTALLLIENGQGQRFVPLRLAPENKNGSPG